MSVHVLLYFYIGHSWKLDLHVLHCMLQMRHFLIQIKILSIYLSIYLAPSQIIRTKCTIGPTHLVSLTRNN